MGTWWMTEAVSIEITGLLPIALFPLLKLGALKETCAPYANEVIFLFLGGMIIGQALEKSGLHRRFALGVVSLVGVGPRRLIAGFLCATAFISMWVSNAAATVMMMPIAISVCLLLDRETGADAPRARQGFEASLLIAVAFGASIGGVGTLVGTPPMAQMAAFVRKELNVDLSFQQWLKIGLPVVLIMLPAAWACITLRGERLPTRSLADVHALVQREVRALGPFRWPEWAVLAVFVLAVAAWVFSKQLGVGDATIAIAAALVLFVLPWDRHFSRPLITWDDASRLPWGVLIMFGGGLSLADAISRSGLDTTIADAATGLRGAPFLLVLFVLAFGAVALTEFASNTALVAAGLPVVAALAKALGIPPVPACMVLSLAASLGFMMPAGTAPNALVFSTGRMTMRQMMKAGLRLDIVTAALAPLVIYGAWKLGLTP
jgi:sodium-dependent dicarboxylate transporter 2/3/5